MLKIVVCTSKKERFVAIKNLLHEGHQSEVVLAQNKEEVNKVVAHAIANLVIYDFPFLDDAKEMSYMVSLKQLHPAVHVLLLLSHKHVDKVRDKVERYGVFVLAKPIQNDMFSQLLSFIKANVSQVQQYQKKQKSLVQKINEIKKVDLAKCLLMENEYFSESMAHRHIEKKAMDTRRKRIEIAEEIIKQYRIT